MINHKLLQQFADSMGIDPLFFNNIDISGCGIENTSLCSVFWEYYKNQSYPSKMALNTALFTARLRIAEYIGVWPTDEWIENEEIDIPTHYDRREGRQLLINHITFKSRYNMKLAGIKNTIVITTATLTYVDEDGDGFKEKANFTFTLPEGIKLDDIKTRYINGVEVGLLNLTKASNSQTVTGYIYAYELIKPELYLTRSFGEQMPLNACDDDNFVSQLEVIYETADTCLAHAEIIVEKGNCVGGNCEYEAIPACIKIVDNCEGYFTVIPGSYVDDCFVATSTSCLLSGRPVKIRINYLTGPNKNLKELLLSPLFELAAALMVPAHCKCDCYEFSIAAWQQDVSVKTANGVEWRYPINQRANAIWGQTVGAIQAQQFVESLVDICT